MPLSQREKFERLTNLQCKLSNISANRANTRKTLIELGISISPPLLREMQNSGLGNMHKQRLDRALARVTSLRNKMKKIMGKK